MYNCTIIQRIYKFAREIFIKKAKNWLKKSGLIPNCGKNEQVLNQIS